MRYVDDVVILARRMGPELWGWIEHTLEARMGLEVNREKTQVVRLRWEGGHVDFLGFTLRFAQGRRGGGHSLKVAPSRKARAREGDRLRAMTSSRVCWKPIPALICMLIRSSRPADSVLGRVEGLSGFHNVARHEGATTVPGLVLYRFNASVIFYNAPYFKRRVLAVVAASPDVKWLVVDGAPIVHLDSTGADTIAALADELRAKGVRLVLSDAHARVQRMLERSGALEHLGPDSMFPTLRSALEAYQSGSSKEPSR